MIEVEASLPIRAPAREVMAKVGTLAGFLRFEEEFVHVGEVRREDGWEEAEATVRVGPLFFDVRVRHRVEEDGTSLLEVRGLPGVDLVQDLYRARDEDGGCRLTHVSRVQPRGASVGWLGRLLPLGRMRRHNLAELAKVRAVTAGGTAERALPAPVRAGIPEAPRVVADTTLLVHPDLPRDATDIFLDVTRRCDLRCPACFANANEGPGVEASVHDVVERLSRVPTRPLVSIKGGEPTLREDLPEIIRAIRGLGFPLKLNTNGLRFADPDYARAIREAGCDTVCIQWDGLDDELIRALRGRSLLDRKLEAMQNLFAQRFHVILAVMVVEDGSREQIRAVLDYALDHPRISLVGWLPVSRIGRNDLGEGGRGESLSLRRFFELLDSETGGRLTRADFDLVGRLAGRFSRLVGSSRFQALDCTCGLFLLHRGRDFVPLSRLLSPAAWRGRTWLLPAVAALAGRIVRGRILEANPRLLGIVVEKFLDGDGFDLTEASACRKFYLVQGGFVQPCIYNVLLAN